MARPNSCALGNASAKGQAQLQWQWNGGWHTLQQQLQAAAQGTAWPASQTAFSVQATLSTPQLETVLPAGASSNVATSIQWRAVKAELQGQMTQANLTVEGEARTGRRFALADGESLRIYLRRDSDLAAAQAVMAGSGIPVARITYLRGDVCRRELDVELEGVFVAA